MIDTIEDAEDSQTYVEPSIFDRMRNNLRPRGSAPIVGIGFEGIGGKSYLHEEFVHSCINTLEQKVMMATAGIEPLNPLEKLAAQLLMSSAYIEPK